MVHKPAWDISRFVQTLSYFEAIPVISWVQKMFSAAPLPPQPQAGVIFDFRAPATPLNQTWGALDDVVMGGVSASSIQPDAEGAHFIGSVSTANSGGFASIRTRNFEPPLKLSQYLGIELRLKGDGKRYKFLLRDEETWDSVAYSYSFDTIPGVWITVHIPFAELTPVFRAKTVKNGPTLNANRVRSLQLMLSKFEYDGALNPHFAAGEFSLVLASISVYE
jgi:hypothetical protein